MGGVRGFFSDRESEGVGSIWSGWMWAFDFVRWCSAVFGGVRLCSMVFGGVRLCSMVFGGVRQPVVVRGAVLCSARYPRRGAGMTDLVGAGMTRLGAGEARTQQAGRADGAARLDVALTVR